MRYLFANKSVTVRFDCERMLMAKSKDNSLAVIDRAPMRGCKANNIRNRYQIITTDSEQKLVGLYRTLAKALEALPH